MNGILIGREHHTGKPFRLPAASFPLHYHLIGATGKGKTTFLLTLLTRLLLDPVFRPCVFLLDRMGGFSMELLRFFSSQYCPQHVRDRLIHVQTAHEGVVLPLHPLHFRTPAEGDFRVDHTTELILRGLESTNIGAMPRLKNWTGTTLLSDMLLGLSLADSMHFLLPGSPHRQRLVGLLPEQLQYEWREILHARGAQESVLLESTRNRLKPFWTQQIPRVQFGSTVNRFDVLRWMGEGRIVLIDLSPHGRVSDHMADCQAGMILNEILTVARSLPPGTTFPTFLVLDEFQRYVGPDIFNAIPEVRQKGVRLVLSHQSFSQLKRGDFDLTSLIFQCQNRVMFGVGGEDAELLAEEIASLTFDPMRVKDEIQHCTQRTVGHRVVELTSHSRSDQVSEQWNEQTGTNWSDQERVTRGLKPEDETKSTGGARGGNAAKGHGGGRGSSSTVGAHQTLVPVLEDFWQVSSRNYFTFDEQRKLCSAALRKKQTGQAFIMLANDGQLHEVDIDRAAVGHLALDWADVEKKLPQVAEAYHRMIEANFRQDCFVSPSAVDLEARLRLERLLNPAVRLQSPAPEEPSDEGQPEDGLL